MFSESQATRYCCEPIEKIQGFQEASASTERYHIHHRFEEMGLYRKDLLALGLLYNRPACELIFIRGKEHNSNHSTYDLSEAYLKVLFKKGNIPEFTKEHRKHISESKKGVKQSPEHTANVIKACRKIRESQDYRNRLRVIQEKAGTTEKRNEQSSIIKNLWNNNQEYRKTLQAKAKSSVNKDLKIYKQYKANGGTLSWKPFRTWLAQQRKSK